MSHLCSFMEFIDKYCKDDPQIEELLKKIDLLERENNLLQTAYKEHERENMRLQMERFNVETIVEPLMKLLGDETVEATNMQLMETCISIRYSISQIDFSKIVQCNHIQMEQSYREEWQQLQEYTVSQLEWHEKMEQRHVVQRYRQTEKAFKEMEQNLQKSQYDNDKSEKQSLKGHSAAKQKLNALILYLVEGSNKLTGLREIYKSLTKLIDLRNQKSKLQEKCESEENKAFSSMMPYKNTCKSSANTGVLNTFQYEMPKFPSFNDILKTFNQVLNQNELMPQITMIENTTNIMILSNNSEDNSMEINQSITTKHTKHVHYKMQLDENLEFKETTDCTNSDCSSVGSAPTNTEFPQLSLDAKEPHQHIEMKDVTPIIDLLTPSDNANVSIKDSRRRKSTNTKTDKPKIEILECLVVKPPSTNIKGNDYTTMNKENISPYLSEDSEFQENTFKFNKNHNETMPPPPLKPVTSQKNHDTINNDFKNDSISMEPCSDDSSDCLSKDFDKYLSESSELPCFNQSERTKKVVDQNNSGGVAQTRSDKELGFEIPNLDFDTTDASDGDMFGRKDVMDFFI